MAIMVCGRGDFQAWCGGRRGGLMVNRFVVKVEGILWGPCLTNENINFFFKKRGKINRVSLFVIFCSLGLTET